MAQYTFDNLDINVDTGSTLAVDLNGLVPAVQSQHSGSSAPGYASQGMIWADTTSANIVYRIRGAAAFRPAFQLDDTSGVARVALDADGDSYIVSDTDDVIRAVISGSEVSRFLATGLQVNGDLLTGIADSAELTAATSGKLISAENVEAAIDEHCERVITTGYAETSAAHSGTTIALDATPPQNTEGVEFLSCSITRKSASSKIRIQANCMIGSSVNATVIVALFQDAVSDAIAAVPITIGGTDHTQDATIDVEVDSGATGSTTFTLRVGSNTGTGYVNRSTSISDLLGSAGLSSMRVTEFLRS